MTDLDITTVPVYSDLLRLDGAGAVVVGAGQGMGRQTAHALAQQGATVFCVDIDKDRAEHVAGEIGGLAWVADATASEDAAEIVARGSKELGRIHVLADVVGMARYAALIDMPEEDWDFCHRIVVRHAYHMIKYCGRQMAADGGGSMVFVGSISGVSSAPFHGAYGAAKAGLLHLVRTAAIELKPSGVRVNSVTPGDTATPRLIKQHGSNLSDGTLSGAGSTSDIAAAILFLCSDLSRHITGQNVAVDGGYLAAGARVATEAPLPPGRVMGEP